MITFDYCVNMGELSDVVDRANKGVIQIIAMSQDSNNNYTVIYKILK